MMSFQPKQLPRAPTATGSVRAGNAIRRPYRCAADLPPPVPADQWHSRRASSLESGSGYRCMARRRERRGPVRLPCSLHHHRVIRCDNGESSADRLARSRLEQPPESPPPCRYLQRPPCTRWWWWRPHGRADARPARRRRPPRQRRCRRARQSIRKVDPIRSISSVSGRPMWFRTRLPPAPTVAPIPESRHGPDVGADLTGHASR